MEGTRMYFLPEPPAGVPTVEDLERAIDITHCLVMEEPVEGNTQAPDEKPVPVPLASRAERRACAKRGHQRKPGWGQCANCGVPLG